MSQGIAGAVVTDDLVVERAWLWVDTTGVVRGIADIKPQPAFALHYKGQGRFDLADRELRATVSRLADKIMESVATYGSKDLDITITAYNYTVGQYKNGQVTLEGEQ